MKLLDLPAELFIQHVFCFLKENHHLFNLRLVSTHFFEWVNNYLIHNKTTFTIRSSATDRILCEIIDNYLIKLENLTRIDCNFLDGKLNNIRVDGKLSEFSCKNFNNFKVLDWLKLES